MVGRETRSTWSSWFGEKPLPARVETRGVATWCPAAVSRRRLQHVILFVLKKPWARIPWQISRTYLLYTLEFSDVFNETYYRQVFVSPFSSTVFSTSSVVSFGFYEPREFSNPLPQLDDTLWMSTCWRWCCMVRFRETASPSFQKKYDKGGWICLKIIAALPQLVLRLINWICIDIIFT